MPFELWNCRWPLGSEEVILGDSFGQPNSGMAALAAARDHLRKQHPRSSRLYPVNVLVEGRVGVLVHDPTHDSAVFISRMHLTGEDESRNLVPTA